MPDWTISPERGRLEQTVTIGALLQGRQGFKMAGTPTSVVLHKAIPPHLYTMQGRYSLTGAAGNCYYLRVTQENGQMAWASPVWLGTG